MIGTAIILLGVVIYLPVLVSWRDREKDGEFVRVKSSWFMKRAAFLYVPLTKLHASIYGYEYDMIFNVDEDMIFIKYHDLRRE